MPRTKRHFKGNNKTDDRNRRKEREVKWKSTRGDNNSKQGAIPIDNSRMEAFYKAQNFVSDDEWTAFMEHLRSPLPACFRLSPDYVFVDELRKQLNEYVGQTIESDSIKIDPVKQLKWYPGEVGYQLGTDRRSIRKLDVLKQLHQWMMKHTDNGNITRQEAVSMVPPLALNVESHHKCLDMCAAPGSKTSQLLEIINRSIDQPLHTQGLVVANDSDTDRAYMLVHQCKRINSPLLVVTTHKGQLFPQLFPSESTLYSPTAEIISPYKSLKDGYFDRVLCDVPCSGDGTLRKNPCIWSKWSTTSGANLHPLQLMIATRGYQLLKQGGLMVYSTCSMSPYENEAVVAELLRQNKGKLELIDGRQFLPLFKARAGLNEWYVLDDYLCIRQENRRNRNDSSNKEEAIKEENIIEENLSTVNDMTNMNTTTTPATTTTNIDSSISTKIYPPAIQHCINMGMTYFPTYDSVPEHLNKKWRKSMFPPTSEEKEWMHLERCLRCVPHDEDTGGFFVATLRKLHYTKKQQSYSSSTNISGSVGDSNDDQDNEGEEDENVTMEIQSAMDGNNNNNNEEGVEGGDGDDNVLSCVVNEDDDNDNDNGVIEDNSGAVGEDQGNENNDEDEDENSIKKKIKIEHTVLDTTNVASTTSTAAAESSQCVNNATTTTANDNANNNSNTNAPNKRTLPQKGLVDYKPWDEEAYQKVKAFYGFSDELTIDKFMIREDFCGHKPNGVSSKSIYYIPPSVRDLMQVDKENRLKIVCAGIKVLEKKVHKHDGSVEYRLLQEGAAPLLPYINTRKVLMNIQDFSNLLEGGLVSFSTLSASTVQHLNTLTTGGMIAVYKFSPDDVIISSDINTVNTTTTGTTTIFDDLNTAHNKDKDMDTTGLTTCTPIISDNTPYTNKENSTTEMMNESKQKNSYHTMDHYLHAICWRGNTRTLNVMCGKTEIESMKHQLMALKVLRPKITVKQITPATFVTEGVNSSNSDTVAPSIAIESSITVDVMSTTTTTPAAAVVVVEMEKTIE